MVLRVGFHSYYIQSVCSATTRTFYFQEFCKSSLEIVCNLSGIKGLNQNNMRESGKKYLLWSTIILLLLSIAGIAFSLLFPSGAYDIFLYIGLPGLFLSLIALTLLISLKYHDRKWLSFVSRVSTFLFPLFIFIFYLITRYIQFDGMGIFCSFVIFEFMLVALFNIFIFREIGEIKGILILLLFIIVSFIILRISFLQARLPDFDVICFVLLTGSTGCGMLMYGFRCLFRVEKNFYLKIVSFMSCLLIAFGSIVFVAKMQSARVAVLELIYFIPAFLMTLIVLFSLPLSGYIHWSEQHKRILKKIMISWIFFLLIFSISFVFPDTFKKIVFKGVKPKFEFRMDDYELKDKNGLKKV
jgi:hypothetical protein